ncbi:MAG: hypothetical protein R3A51_22105 [Nannocystaceae bacterium]
MLHQRYLVRGGRSRGQAQEQMREQMREWLLCCNPSPYTFPLLIDGLAQLIGDDDQERATFMQDVQDAMRNSGCGTRRPRADGAKGRLRRATS